MLSTTPTLDPPPPKQKKKNGSVCLFFVLETKSTKERASTRKQLPKSAHTHAGTK